MQTIVEPWNQLEKIHGYTYQWNDHHENQHFNRCGEVSIGCCAQDILGSGDVGKCIVSENPNSGLLAVDYSKLIPLMLEGMHVLKERCDALERKLQRNTTSQNPKRRRRK